jgi:hypothetical protein
MIAERKYYAQYLVCCLVIFFFQIVSSFPFSFNQPEYTTIKVFDDSDIYGSDHDMIEDLRGYLASESLSCKKNSSILPLVQLNSEYITKMSQVSLQFGGLGIVSTPRKRATALLTKFSLTLPPGDIVETGCYFGTSAAIMMDILIHFDLCDRRLWVFDSFEGLPVLSKEDRNDGIPGDFNISVQVLKNNLLSAGVYQENKIVITKGWFNETLPLSPVKQIAFLRLDGDLFLSTWDSLIALYDKVIVGGVIYVDDYGSYRGCRDAIDKFRSMKRIYEPLHYIEESPILGNNSTVKRITFEAVWWVKSNTKYNQKMKYSKKYQSLKERYFKRYNVSRASTTT